MSDSAATPTLDERTRAFTRQLILDALAEVVVETGLHKFSVQDVADRAGVSHRTVYRYFANRESLVEALTDEMDRLVESRDLPLVPDGDHSLPAAIADIFRVFDENPDLIRSVAVGSLAGGDQPPSRRARDRAIRDWVAERARGLPKDELERASAVVRYLANSVAWVVLTRQLGLASEDAARAVRWAIETLVRDLEERACQAGDGQDAGMDAPAPSPPGDSP